MIADLAIVALALGGYYLSLRIWPYTYCRRCQGSKTNLGSNRRRWGNCRSCGGTGRKDRLGVRLFMKWRP